MNISLRVPGTQEILNDLLGERGLTEWQVVRGIRVSTDSEEVIDVIYGNVLASKLEDERLERKRKRKTAQLSSDKQQSTYCCFVVLPAISPTLSIKRLLELQQCADANKPSVVSSAITRTFLGITDAANISYYVLQIPAILP